MKNITKFLIFTSIFLMLVVPVVFVSAKFQGPCPINTHNDGTRCVPDNTSPTGLVPCNNTPDIYGKIAQPCDFNALMALVNKVINFILYYMAIPIAAMMFAFAGFLMVTAGGEAVGARTKAKNIFTNTLIGLILAAACWLIIKLILSILGYNGTWIGF